MSDITEEIGSLARTNLEFGNKCLIRLRKKAIDGFRGWDELENNKHNQINMVRRMENKVHKIKQSIQNDNFDESFEKDCIDVSNFAMFLEKLSEGDN